MKLLLANTLNVIWIISIGSTLIVHIGSLITSFNSSPLVFMLIPVFLAWVIALLLQLWGVFVGIGRMISNGSKGKMLFGPTEAKPSPNLPVWVIWAGRVFSWYALIMCVGVVCLTTSNLADPTRYYIGFFSGVSLAIYWQIWMKTYEWQRNLQAASETLEPLI